MFIPKVMVKHAEEGFLWFLKPLKGIKLTHNRKGKVERKATVF